MPAGPSERSQTGNPKGVVCADAEDAGVASIEEEAVVGCMQAEAIQHIELDTAAQTEIGFRFRHAAAGYLHHVYPGSDPGSDGERRVRNGKSEPQPYGEAQLRFIIGKNGEVGLGVSYSALKSHRERNERAADHPVIQRGAERHIVVTVSLGIEGREHCGGAESSEAGPAG